MKKTVKYTLGCGCLSIVAIIVLVAIFAVYMLSLIYYEGKPNNARFHNAKEISDYYGVRIPEVELVDSSYKRLVMPAFTTEYYINTYTFKDSPSKNAIDNAIKRLNSVEIGNNNVEAKLSDDKTKLTIWFHFVYDSGDGKIYEPEEDAIK